MPLRRRVRSRRSPRAVPRERRGRATRRVSLGELTKRLVAHPAEIALAPEHLDGLAVRIFDEHRHADVGVVAYTAAVAFDRGDDRVEILDEEGEVREAWLVHHAHPGRGRGRALQM